MFDGVYYDFPKAWTFLFVFLACDALCRMRERALYFPSLARFAAPSLKPSYLLWVLKWLAIVMFLGALMSPYKKIPHAIAPPPGKTIVVVLGSDSDGRTATALNDFIDAHSGDDIGLVAYDTRAFIAAPPTRDHPMLGSILSALRTGEKAEAKALDAAIAKGYARLEASSAQQKVLIVLAAYQGAELRKDFRARQQRAQAAGVRLYAVVPGETEPLETPAKQTGGALYTAGSSDAVEAALIAIGRVERPTATLPKVFIRRYYYIYPLFVGFFSLLLYVYLRNRRAL